MEGEIISEFDEEFEKLKNKLEKENEENRK